MSGGVVYAIKSAYAFHNAYALKFTCVIKIAYAISCAYAIWGWHKDKTEEKLKKGNKGTKTKEGASS